MIEMGPCTSIWGFDTVGRLRDPETAQTKMFGPPGPGCPMGPMGLLYSRRVLLALMPVHEEMRLPAGTSGYSRASACESKDIPVHAQHR